MAQRFNRTHAGRLKGRQRARDESHKFQQQSRGHHGELRDPHVNVAGAASALELIPAKRQRLQRRPDAIAARDAEYAADGNNRHGLQQKLERD
jgi:hypothetical protein